MNVFITYGEDGAVDGQVSEWLTIAEACEYLKVSRRTLYRWMSAGEVPYFQLAAGGMSRRIRREHLEDLLVDVEAE